MTQEEDQLQSKALEQFKTGKSLFGKDGAFAPMLKQSLESAPEAEMDVHPDEAERLEGNKRNGKGRKTIKSSTGPVEIETPRDRQSTFAPPDHQETGDCSCRQFRGQDHWLVWSWNEPS